MIALPAIPQPARYQGLYVFDFGDHVSVGYTAGEIRILHDSARFRNAQAYEIYRVDHAGRLELRGVGSRIAVEPVALCFLRTNAAHARRDYEDLSQAAAEFPLPCVTQLRLARSFLFEPGNLTALVHASWAAHLMSQWLENRMLSPGNRVVAGPDVLARLESPGGLTLASCTLPSTGPIDRPAEEVLATVDMPLQR